jgi:hypothetical protein
MKKLIFGFGAVLVLGILAMVFVEVPYLIRSRGIVLPVEEWSLHTGTGGTLVQLHENHLSGVVGQYSVSEYQRGDVARYVFNEELLASGKVHEGDTVAWVYTGDIQLDLIALQGDLAYQRSLLQVYLAGDRPEEIAVADSRIELARQELENQQAQTERVVRLHQEGVVSQQEYELSVNALRIREYALDVAESLRQALEAGRKPEDLEMVRSRIASLEIQEAQLKKHMDAFHLVSPISGVVIRERNPLLADGTEAVLRIADLSVLAIFLPIDYHEGLYAAIGQKVRLHAATGGFSVEGSVVSVDNTVRLMNNRPKIFLGVMAENEGSENLYRNMMVEASVVGDTIRLWEYLQRMTKGVLQN